MQLMVAINASASGTNANDQLVELKSGIITFLLPFALITICISVILLNILGGPPSTAGLALCFTMSCIWIASFLLCSRSLHIAIYLFLIGTMLVAIAGAYEVQRVDILNIFPFLVILSVFLLSRTEAAGMMIFALLLISAVSAVIDSPVQALIQVGSVIIAFMVGTITVYRIRQIIELAIP
jgi:hypothetical protein